MSPWPLRLMIAALTLAGCATLSTVVTPPASACRCAREVTREEALAGAAVAFVGRVADIYATRELFGLPLLTRPDVRATFQVLRPLKGDPGPTATVVIGRDPSGCDATFELGGRYLVVAHSSATRGLATDLCSGNRRLASTDGLADEASIDDLPNAEQRSRPTPESWEAARGGPSPGMLVGAALAALVGVLLLAGLIAGRRTGRIGRARPG